jgi:hypothetical protein
MKRMQEEIHESYGTYPDLAPYRTLFSLLRKHHLGRLADQFVVAREPEFHRDDEDFENVMELHEYDENGNYKFSTSMSHLRAGRKFLAGPGGKPIVLNECGCCRKVKEGIEAEYCCSRHDCGHNLSTCKACTRYRTCAVCARERCFCRFVKCSMEDCPNLMCRCQIFGEWCERAWDDMGFEDEEHAISCAFVVYPDDDDAGNSPAEEMLYCQEHQPDGAQPAIPQSHVSMPDFWRMMRG